MKITPKIKQAVTMLVHRDGSKHNPLSQERAMSFVQFTLFPTNETRRIPPSLTPEAKRGAYFRRKAKLLAAGLCIRCTKYPSANGTQECLECQANGIIRKQKLRNDKKIKGICVQCPEPTINGKVFCETHLRQARENNKLKKAAGICYFCSNPVSPGKCHCDKHRRANRIYHKKARIKLKKRILAAYGGERCACCGETNFYFLTIDHIDGGGTRHRKESGVGFGASFYKWLVRNKFPNGYQVLCCNCNFAKGQYGKCPHEETSA